MKLTTVAGVETEFRLEAFNLLNHPVFANPATYDRLRQRRDDLEPDALHAHAAAADSD